MGRLGVCTSPNGVLQCKSSTCPGSAINSNLAIVRTGQLDKQNSLNTWNAIASDLTQLLEHEQDEVKTSLKDYELAALEETPVVNDSHLAEIYFEAYKIMSTVSEVNDAVKKFTARLNPSYPTYRAANVPDIEARIADLEYKLSILDKELTNKWNEAEVYEQKWREGGCWSRAYLVTNGNGHVHKTRSCSTCYPTTQFVWLPQYSGQSEELIVSDAGMAACSICYPDAPVDVLKRESKIDNPLTREERMKRKAEKEAKAVAAAAKAITMPDGSVLKTEYSGVVRTERTASIEAVDTASFIYAVDESEFYDKGTLNMGYVDKRREDLHNLIQALAFKHGVTVEEETAAVREKAIKKFKKDYKK